MTEPTAGWPPGVQPMVVQDLERLGTDKDNRLYWDGKLVRMPLTLTTPQSVLAVLAALASIATIFTGLNNASIFLCARDVHWLGCPSAQVSAPPVTNSWSNLRSEGALDDTSRR